MRNAYFGLFFILLALAGCQKDNTITEKLLVDRQTLSAAIYPHTSEMLKDHGTIYLNNKKSCTTCHGDDLSGGTSKISCQKCHADYPHAPLYAMGKNHGEQFGKLIAKMRAESQDPSDGKYLNNNSCTMCHSSEKAVPDAHAESAKNVSCNSCHIGFAHDSSHGKYGGSKILKSSCFSCHTNDGADKTVRNHMPNYNNCNACHDDNSIGTKPVLQFMTEEEAEQVGGCLYDIREGNDCVLKPAGN